MHEKDQFGDKLKDKERAEENLYFAKRDRELLEKLRGKDDASGAAALREAVLGRCPKCGDQLAHKSVDQVEVDECPSCKGVWLDRGELESLSGRENESWLGRFFRSSLTQAR
jgi:hypothetical protein